jgi:crotonobetainyl-CoA:carnitine CoA-transferase CaiB-like acyl-CoA transferase
VQVAALANQEMNYLAPGVSPRRLGNAHPNIVPYQAFATSDGHIILAVGNDAQFARFCALAGRAELAADACFQTNSARVEHRDRLVPQVAEIMRTRSSEQWLDALNGAGIPCGPINDIEQVFDDPQVRFRGLQMQLDHPSAGSVASVANPIRLSRTPVEYRSAPPLLGQHTDAVLARVLQLGAAHIEALRGDGVIG